MKKKILILLLLNIAMSLYPKEFRKTFLLGYENLDEKSRSRLKSLGISEKQLINWHIKHFDHNNAYYLSSPLYDVKVKLEKVLDQQYKIVPSPTIVDHSRNRRNRSDNKDFRRYDVFMLYPKLRYSMHKIKSLENKQADILIEELLIEELK